MLHSAKAKSLAIVGIVTFVGDAARGILFPALWPLCQHVGMQNMPSFLHISCFHSLKALLLSAWNYCCFFQVVQKWI